MGDPRYQIDVPEHVFAQAHARVRQAGWRSTSAWLRHLLRSWDGLPLVPRPRRPKQLSVRLDPHHEGLLDHIANVSDTSHSEAFAILVETALLGDIAPPHEAIEATEPNPSRRKARRSARPAHASNQAERDEPRTEPARHAAPGVSSRPAERDEPRPEPTLYAAPHESSHEAEHSANTFDLAEFARAVQEIADSEPHARFGKRTFISAVWRRFRRHPMAAGMSVQEFKGHLIEANRADLLALHRADLVAAMNSDEVRDSETRELNATFHFIESPRVPRGPPRARA